MEDVYRSFSNDAEYLAQRRPRPNITQLKIPVGSKYEIITCKLLEEGNPKNLTANLLTVQFMNDGKNATVSRTAVQSVIDRLNPITNVVTSRGQWSNNHEAWVKARYNWVLHFLVRLDETCNHKSVKKHLQKFDNLPDWLNRKVLEEAGYTFSKHQICWYDECHVYQELGPESPIQYRFKWSEDGTPIPNLSDDYADLCDPQLVPPVTQDQDQEKSVSNDNDGQENEQEDDNDLMHSQKWHASKNEVSKHYRHEDFCVKFKFQQQARFMFGVALILTTTGLSKGVRIPMATYSGKK